MRRHVRQIDGKADVGSHVWVMGFLAEDAVSKSDQHIPNTREILNIHEAINIRNKSGEWITVIARLRHNLHHRFLQNKF